jgi:DNA-binding NtrC family response regulator
MEFLVMTAPKGNHVFLGMKAIIRSEPMKRLLETVYRVARVDASVLITGESGAGKEIIARALHHYSPRADRPWVDVSCATLPEHLVESELFGHEKGAFSSADSPKPGLFEMAHTGTLLLDEIGELEPRMQVKLLRILDGASFYRLGGTRKIEVDVRVIAATNQDLGAMVQSGAFRADLYHRLSQIQIDVPPLRQRRADILPLAEHFLELQRPEAVLLDESRNLLTDYGWPGNVRELRNVVVKAAVLTPSGEIGVLDLPDHMRMENGGDLMALAHSVGLGTNGQNTDWSLESMERRMIFQVLQRTGGHQQQAAELLGISRRTLSRKLRAYATDEVVL